MKQNQIKKPPSNISHILHRFSTQIPSSYTLKQKYSLFYYSYEHIQINNLVFNEKCHITSKFKDYLIIDDNTEFLRRFYSKEEIPSRLSRIYSFYVTYSKIFPNYMILPEANHLYRNIRKKQKMIDDFNQIKREEEENRLNLNLGKKNSKGGLVVFNQSIQRSIRQYEPSLSHLRSNEGEEDTINSFSISLSIKTFDQYVSSLPKNGGVNDNNIIDQSGDSLACIVQSLNKPYQGIKTDFFIETPKKSTKITYATGVPSTKTKDTNEQQTLSALNNNRKFFGHKATVSNPALKNEKIQIINNYHNIILSKGSNAIININTNYHCAANDNNNKENINSNLKAKDTSKSPNTKDKRLYDSNEPMAITSSRPKNNCVKTVSITKPSNSKSIKKDGNLITKGIASFEIFNSFKSPEKIINNCPIALAKTKTLSTPNNMIPFFQKNTMTNTMTELQNKVNPFKVRFEKRNQSKKKQPSISSYSSSKKSYDIQTAQKTDFKKVFCTEGDKGHTSIQTDSEIKSTKAEMKNRYKLFMENFKKGIITLRKSSDSNKKQLVTVEALSKKKNSKVFTSNSTQKQQQFSRITIKKTLMKPFDSNPHNDNTNEHKGCMTTQVKLTPKIIVQKEKSNNPTTLKIAETSGIKSINFKALNANTTKMKFIHK